MRMRSLLASLPLGLMLLAAAPQTAERERALSALNAARNAVNQLDAGAGTDARAHLSEAEALFAEGQFEEAAARADEAWRLLQGAGPTGTTFRVEVDEGGKTKVSAKSGGAVRVEARGVERSVEPGQEVSVAPGDMPSEPRAAVRPPRRPELAGPANDALLRLHPDKTGKLGPVKLTWKRTAGARAYVVELVPEAADGPPVVLQTSAPSLELPRLAPGAYRWTVKAVGEEAVASATTEPRRFRLEAETLKLDVRGTGWK